MFILCMAIGLLMKMRPLVILERASVCSVIAAALGYVLASVVERCASPQLASLPNPSEQQETAGSEEAEETEQEA